MMKKLFALALFLSVQGINAININVYSLVLAKMYTRFNFRGDSFGRIIPAATPTASALEDLNKCNKESLDWQTSPRSPIPNTLGHASTYQTGVGGVPKAIQTAGWMGVDDWRLHIGFEDVHTVEAKVGDVWGRNPDTGCPLVFTQKMFEQRKGVDYKLGLCWGIQPKFYSSVGQALFKYFALIVVPVKNAADNNNWWPSFRIIKLREGTTHQKCPWRNGCDELQWPD